MGVSEKALRLTRLQILLILLGIADSSYLLYGQIYCPLEFCPATSILSFPPYIPAFLGLLWFLASIPILLLKQKIFLETWKITGVFGAFFLGSYAILHSYFCPYCYFAYVVGLLLIYFSK